MLEKLKQYWLTVPKWIRNRYFLVLAAFVILLFFIDTNNAFRLVDRQSQLRKLVKQEEQMQQELINLNEQKEAFQNDKEALEKFAREEYRMKKDDEEVFVIVEKGKNEE